MLQLKQVQTSDEKSSVGDLLVEGLVAVGAMAVFSGVNGLAGKYVCSFFNPVLTSGVGGFCAFAGVGVLALPLLLIPRILEKHFMGNSSFLTEHPNLKNFLSECFSFIVSLAAVTASAAIMGSSVGPTVVCMICVPAMCSGLTMILNVINAFNLSNDAGMGNTDSATTPALSSV